MKFKVTELHFQYTCMYTKSACIVHKSFSRETPLLASVFTTNKTADDNHSIQRTTLTHHQSESISITSNQVRNDQGPAALHQSSKGAVGWL